VLKAKSAMIVTAMTESLLVGPKFLKNSLNWTTKPPKILSKEILQP
jgi:hypothetical protein